MAALLYAALAGFGVPVARAAIMVTSAAAAGLAQRRVMSWDTWLFALGMLVIVDPLCLLGTGTWLSFGAVAVLIWLARRRTHGIVAAVHTHVALTLAMAPLTACLFGQVAASAPLANLLAVPLTSVLVVPLALAGVLCLPWHAGLAALLWDMAGRLWDWLWWVLARLADMAPALDIAAWFDPATTALVTAGMALLVLPRAVGLRPLGALLCATVLLPHDRALADGEFRLHVLDVGQGLAVLVQTRRAAVLYDAGPRWSGGGRDAGAAIVLPALRALGVRRLESFIVSHADLDHAGGAAAVLRGMPVARVRWAEVVRGMSGTGATRCEVPVNWSLDGVEFRFLHPRAADGGTRNDRSCVLLIAGRHGRALLPGDIEAATETLLLERDPGALAADVLVVPHHGSATSSSARFIAAVQPRLAVIAAGYRNRYGFPQAVVLARYRAAGAALLNTADSGAIRVDIGAQGIVASVWRARGLGFWREPPPVPAVPRVRPGRPARAP